MNDTIVKRQWPEFFNILKKIFQVTLYIPIQILFIPFVIIGLVDALLKEMVKSKKLGVSFTAIKALQYRWLMHHFNIRPDTLSVAFIKKFPCESHFGLWSVFGALILSQRMFGFTSGFGKLEESGKENFSSTAYRRVIMFDEIMEKYVDEVDQIVIPGVGFDLIALHYTKEKKVKVFELDQITTLNEKIRTLKKAGIEHDWINYIAVDYSNESWVNKLLDAGFDKTKKTLFLWQSVSLFLDEKTVKDTIREMTDLCVAGSIIAQDFYSKEFILGKTSRAVKKSLRLLQKMGEPWMFGLDMSNNPKVSVELLIEECGLELTHYIQFGEKLEIEPYYCIVEAKKKLYD